MTTGRGWDDGRWQPPDLTPPPRPTTGRRAGAPGRAAGAGGDDDSAAPPVLPPPAPAGPPPADRRPLAVGDLVDATIAAIRAAPRVMWTFGALVVVPLGVLAALLSAHSRFAAQIEHGLDVAVPPDAGAEIDAMLSQALVSTLGALTSVLGTALLGAVAAVTLRQVATRGRADVRGVWRTVRPRVPGVLAIAALVVVLLTALVAAVAGAVVLAGALGGVLVAVGAGVLATTAALVAAARVLPVLALAAPQLGVSPAPGVAAALRAATVLARGTRWRLIGIWLLTTITLHIAAGVVSSPVAFVASLLPATSGPVSGWVVAVLGGTVAAALTAPIGALVLAVVHADLAEVTGLGAGAPSGAATPVDAAHAAGPKSTAPTAPPYVPPAAAPGAPTTPAEPPHPGHPSP